jgi:hypothetical protein
MPAFFYVSHKGDFSSQREDMMKRVALVFALMVFPLILSACASMSQEDAGWITLLDGSNPSTLDNWSRIGDANWRMEDGAVVADKGKGNSYIVSKTSYRDFQLKVEFWPDHDTNSGVHVRASDPKDIRDSNSYEANIYDQRPDPSFGTGAITNFAKVSSAPKVGGKWNTYVITARGSTITVELNGVKTVELQDSKFASGPVALQYGGMPGGAIKFRKVTVKPL